MDSNNTKNTKLTPEVLKSIDTPVESIMDFLRNYGCPYHSIVITQTTAELHCAEAGIMYKEPQD